MAESADTSPETVERSTDFDVFDPEADVPPYLPVIARAALERNARDPLVLDLRGLSDATDFFVVLSGDSDVHTRAVAENILEKAEEVGERPSGVEGRSAGRWILIDFIDVVVHVFLPAAREFYQLERLWGDARQAELTD